MAKGYLIIDMPKTCRHIKWGKDGCPFGGAECRVNPLDSKDVMEHIANGTKPEWCPIRPQPERDRYNEEWADYEGGLAEGRNKLIDEMFGGEG